MKGTFALSLVQSIWFESSGTRTETLAGGERRLFVGELRLWRGRSQGSKFPSLSLLHFRFEEYDSVDMDFVSRS